MILYCFPVKSGSPRFPVRFPKIDLLAQDVGCVRFLNNAKYPYACELLGVYRDEEHTYVGKPGKPGAKGHGAQKDGFGADDAEQIFRFAPDLSCPISSNLVHVVSCSMLSRCAP